MMPLPLLYVWMNVWVLMLMVTIIKNKIRRAVDYVVGWVDVG